MMMKVLQSPKLPVFITQSGEKAGAL